MIPDHLAYRVKSRVEAAEFIEKAFGYTIYEEFDINFEDGTTAKCIALAPAEKGAPEIFVSDGSENSIVAKWVADQPGGNGGVHHIAYRVDDVAATMAKWRAAGLAEFTTEKPLECPGLIQCFTKPHPLTGVIYEFIKRDGPGFCAANVKKLMLSSKP
jgi:methylmalonyl-CoA/ethylmalonyl-CoA epimerase